MAFPPLRPDNYDEIFPQPKLDADVTRGRFQGKVAVVTGGASGIGRSTVQRFCNDGASVAILDIDDKLGGALQIELTNDNKDAKFYHCDVTSSDKCADICRVVAESNEGKINYLVNCAASLQHCFRDTLTTEAMHLNKTFETNVLGVTNMVQACYPFMKEDGHNCCVVNLSSVSGHVAQPYFFVPYQVSKAAILCLSKCMALDLSRAGIRVNSVSPGQTWTPSVYCLAKNKCRKSRDENASKLSLIETQVEASGVAAAITFLCSEDARYIDGIDLPVDGGYLALGPEGRG